MSLSSLMNTSVTIQTKTSGIDASMGETAIWVSGCTVPACVQPMSAKERLLFKQRGVTVSHYIYLDASSGATYRDRILDNGTNKLYRVVNEFDMAGQGRAWRLEVLEVAG